MEPDTAQILYEMYTSKIINMSHMRGLHVDKDHWKPRIPRFHLSSKITAKAEADELQRESHKTSESNTLQIFWLRGAEMR